METISQLVAFTFLGLMVSVIISLYFLRGKKPLIAFILCLGGMFGGLLGAMTYVFITGGLEESPFMSIPSLIFAFLICFILMKYFGIKIELKNKRKPLISSLLSTLLMFFVLITILILTTSPFISIEGNISTSELEIPDNIKVIDDTYELKSDNIMTSIASMGNVASNVRVDNIEMAYVNFPFILADPQPGQYISFTAHFAVSGNPWVKPFIRILVFKDANNNQIPDTGDTLWGSFRWKLCLGGSPESSNWRSGLAYDADNNNCFQITWATVNNIPMGFPIFHITSWGTQWKDDNGKFFVVQTPEGYTSPRDQVSWEFSIISGSLQLKETGTMTFSQIAVGSSTDLKGKLYCHADYTGQNCMIVQAFDQNQGADPFDPAAVPIASFAKSFTIGGGGGGGAPTITITLATWTILGMLGSGTLLGAIVVASKYKSFTLFL